jgi:cation:H+ antiporter
MLLLAFVTSLPEAVNSIGATIMEGALDLGVGNLAGSNMFNIIIIVVMDLVQGSNPMLLMVADTHVFVASGGILIMGLVGCAIARYIPAIGVPTPAHWTGIIFSIIIFAAFLAINWMLVHRKDNRPEPTEETAEPVSEKDSANLPSLSSTVITFIVTSAAVVIAALWLLRICDLMSVRPISLGSHSIVLGKSFVGSFLLATATSMPELFVSLGAMRLGRINMSVANIFGSNIMNMALIPIMHMVSRDPNFYGAINPASLVMLFAAIIMSTLFIVGLLSKSKRSFLFLGWEALIILCVYISAAFLVFRMAAH